MLLSLSAGHVQGALSLHRILGRYRTLAGFGAGAIVQHFPGSDELPALLDRLISDMRPGPGATIGNADSKTTATGAACKPIKPRLALPRELMAAKVHRSVRNPLVVATRSILWLCSVLGQFEGEWELSGPGSDALQARFVV